MKSHTPHLLPALVAILLFAGLLFTVERIAHTVEKRNVHALAPLLLQQSNLGSALQREAFLQTDLLPVYGSSELYHEATPYRAYEFFKNYPTGFTVFEVAKGGVTSLLNLQDIAAIGPDLRGKKVVISFTPSMFNSSEISPGAYAGDFSQLHADELAFSPYLSFEIKQMAARRMLDYPDTLRNAPLLQFSLEKLADGSPLSRALYSAILPLGRLEMMMIRLQDHWETLLYILQHPNIKTTISHTPELINWDALIAKAEQEQILITNDDPYGIENRQWREKYHQLLARKIAPGSNDTQFINNLENSKEWGDLEILLRVLKEMGAQPLILSRPIDGPIWDASGVSVNARNVFYDKLESEVAPFGFPLVDFREHDGDKYFSVDQAEHTSRKGWVYVDQTLDAFYHGTLR